MIEKTLICDICEESKVTPYYGDSLPKGWEAYSMWIEGSGYVNYHACDKCAPPREIKALRKIFKWIFRKQHEQAIRAGEALIDELVKK